LEIIKGGGLTPLNNIKKDLSVSERTFERRFLKAVGVTAKQFSQIIRFQNSLDDLKSNGYEVLSDIVYKNGFADQSHFTRVFKAFTGATPSHFSNKG
jgi:AraC-like DNA-binding protein